MSKDKRAVNIGGDGEMQIRHPLRIELGNEVGKDAILPHVPPLVPSDVTGMIIDPSRLAQKVQIPGMLEGQGEPVIQLDLAVD